MPHSQKNLTGLYFCLLALFWGGSFIGIKIVVNILPPFLGAFLRVATALIFLSILFKCMKKDIHLPLALRVRLWITGLFSVGLPMLFLFYGERFISPGLAAILNGTVPVWTFFATLCINSQYTFSMTKLMGILIALTGLVFVFFPALVIDYHPAYIRGAGSVLLMAFSYTFSSILNERMFRKEKKINFQANLYHQMWSSTIFLGIISLVFEQWPSLHSLNSIIPLIFSIIYLGLFSTALGWIIFFFIIREWGAVRASTVMYIVPLVALIWDFLFFHTIPRWTEQVGILSVLLGISLLQWRSFTPPSSPLKTVQHEK